MLTTDQTLACADCNTSFTFTASEQDFYNQKGYSAPRRCKSCRDAAKAARGQGGGNSYGGGSYGGGSRESYGARAPREMHDVTCAGCGTATQVPFKPTSGRPVYCRNCFQR